MGRRRFALVLVFVALVRLIEHRLLATALINGGSSERPNVSPEAKSRFCVSKTQSWNITQKYLSKVL